MTRTLVTLLGRAQKREGGEGYEETIYRFPNGEEDPTAFFGLALARHLTPDEIVILGTAGSLWSVLVENFAKEHGDEGPCIDLMLAEQLGTVDQPLLDRVAPLMGQEMNAVVRPILISAAREESEQYAILEAIDNAVVHNGELHFDVTHSFRHLAMVGFLSSFMLERVRSLDVQGLWYGAFEMRGDSGAVPVLRLDGLMRVRRWLDALNRFDASGDYGIFAPLLREDGVPANKVKCLEDAAFHERTSNVHDAAKKIRAFLSVFDRTLPGASGLFAPRLKLRLGWAQLERLSEQQYKLAQQYFIRRDFVRAAMFGYEASVSRICEERGVPNREYEDRQREALELFKNIKGRRRAAFHSLRKLRNILAHGASAETSHVSTALGDPDRLASELQKAMQGFFG